jgi:hypothetical protein
MWFSSGEAESDSWGGGAHPQNNIAQGAGINQQAGVNCTVRTEVRPPPSYPTVPNRGAVGRGSSPAPQLRDAPPLRSPRSRARGSSRPTSRLPADAHAHAHATTRTSTHAHTRTYTHLHTSANTCTHVRNAHPHPHPHPRPHRRTHTRTRTHTHTHANTHAHTPTPTHTNTQTPTPKHPGAEATHPTRT